MLTLPINHNGVAAFTHVFNHRFLGIQLMTQLIKISHFKLSSHLDRAFSGLQVTEQQFEQSGFTTTIGTQQTDAITTL